jgi:hypothetical protein
LKENKNIIFYSILLKFLLWQPEERGWRAGGSYELNAARSNQHKLLFHILDLPGGILLKAQEPSKSSFLLLLMKKDAYNGYFSRRLLKTK